MFAIGDQEWPGISKLIEECGEVQQVCGKLMGTQGKVEHWDGSNLKDRLEEELADAMAAIMFVIRKNGLNEERIKTRAKHKEDLFDMWHDEQSVNSLKSSDNETMIDHCTCEDSDWEFTQCGNIRCVMCGKGVENEEEDPGPLEIVDDDRSWDDDLSGATR